MVRADALEGLVNDTFRFHFDMSGDVLYLKLLSAENLSTYSEITDSGDLLLRDEKTDKTVGLTVVSWWKRFGQGAVPDSIALLQQKIEPFAEQIAA